MKWNSGPVSGISSRRVLGGCKIEGRSFGSDCSSQVIFCLSLCFLNAFSSNKSVGFTALETEVLSLFTRQARYWLVAIWAAVHNTVTPILEQPPLQEWEGKFISQGTFNPWFSATGDQTSSNAIFWPSTLSLYAVNACLLGSGHRVISLWPTGSFQIGKMFGHIYPELEFPLLFYPLSAPVLIRKLPANLIFPTGQILLLQDSNSHRLG